MAKVKFTKEFFSEFQKNPQSVFSKAGLSTDSDPAFFNKDFKNMSFEQFKDEIRKSRFFNFFDFNA